MRRRPLSGDVTIVSATRRSMRRANCYIQRTQPQHDVSVSSFVWSSVCLRHSPNLTDWQNCRRRISSMFLITYRVSDYSQGFLGEIGDVKYRNFETSLSALNELIWKNSCRFKRWLEYFCREDFLCFCSSIVYFHKFLTIFGCPHESHLNVAAL